MLYSHCVMMCRQYRVGCVVYNVHEQVMPESCHYLTALHALSYPCLVSLLFIPSLYSTFLTQRIFYLLVPSFFIIGSCVYELHHINGLYHNVLPKANFCHFLFFTSKQNCLQKINMLLHDLLWIPIIMQSFTPVSGLVFEIRLSKLKNNNNNNKKNKFEN